MQCRTIQRHTASDGDEWRKGYKAKCYGNLREGFAFVDRRRFVQTQAVEWEFETKNIVNARASFKYLAV